ncbi:hypothetical protein [Portibacter lacus]|uniref:Uncharacterized protein n=1 Tax=Portibacter lacus TaxID=1099794 RepID=A0AA37SRL6_9BACT|nr:hypothetical protein [Portibacter lacus]GLR19621.1 hypothetical protein GCM10007940_42370 [Portibacter lacus]
MIYYFKTEKQLDRREHNLESGILFALISVQNRTNLESRLLHKIGFLILIICSMSFHYKVEKKKRSIICAEYTEKYVDKITGIKRYIAKEKIKLLDYKNKNTFDLIWFKTKGEYTLAFKAKKAMCLDQDVAVSFHLLQGKVVTCTSSHIENCESLMTVNFLETTEALNKLDLISTSEVVGISFENRSKEYKLKLARKHAEQFQETLDCLKTKK